MNCTRPEHLQFIKKPVYIGIALLSFLGDYYYSKAARRDGMDLFETASYNSQANFHEFAVIGVAVNDTFDGNEIWKFRYVSFEECRGDCRYVVYVLDNFKTNPFDVWMKAGSPVFPGREVREKMRKVEVNVD